MSYTILGIFKTKRLVLEHNGEQIMDVAETSYEEDLEIHKM